MNRMIVPSAAAAVAAGATLIYLTHSLLDWREQARTLQVRIAGLEQAAAHRPAGLSSSESSPAVAPVTSAQPTPVAGSDSLQKDAAYEEAERQFRRLSDSVVMASEIAHLRRYIEARYPDLARALKLEPAIANRLFDLMARQELEETNPALMRQGTESERAEFRRWQVEHPERLKAERAAVVGDARAQELNEYFRTIGSRNTVRQLRADLADFGVPLPEAQAEQLIDALAAEQERYDNENKVVYKTMQNGRTPESQSQLRALAEENLNRSREVAALYLDPRQLTQFDAMLDRRRRELQFSYKALGVQRPNANR